MEDILRIIGSISRELDSIANIEFKELNLTKGKYLYLVRICENPGIIQGELAEKIRVDRTTAARAVMKLEKDGFITRGADRDNHKIKRLYPTEQGKAVYPTIKRENSYSSRMALAGFTDAEATALKAMLEKVERNVSIDWNYVKSGHHRKY